MTSRQRDVLVLVSMGLGNAEIGEQLHMSEDTVKTHLRRVFVTLGASNRAHAVRLGFEAGWLACRRRPS